MQFNDTFFDDLLTSAPVDRLVGQVTDGVAADARASAPVDTGNYKAGIVHRKKRTKHRVVHLVVSTDPKTLIIEARTGNLVRALRRRQR